MSEHGAATSVKTATPSPLPDFETLNWDGEITINAAHKALNAGLHNLAVMKAKPGIPAWLATFDPLQGHRCEDEAIFGSSRFFSGGLPDVCTSAKVECHPGHGGAEKALVFICDAILPVGEWYPVGCRMRIVMRKRHGSLQPVLEKPEPEPTRFWTFVLTNEGPDTGWVLASAYPGLPDPNPDADGLEEGDEISLEEAARRGLRVKAD